jgi:hypothetical protein
MPKDKIDYVFPYVDNGDAKWLESFRKYTKNNSKHLLYNENLDTNSGRFRANEEMLKYKFRALEKHMPWVGIVHFIVASPTQIPKWLNKDTVNIVYHYQIVPNQFLPIFNVNPIELNLHNIVGLSDKFIYSNDDVFPNNTL